jgi:hypothetical protein
MLLKTSRPSGSWLAAISTRPLPDYRLDDFLTAMHAL